MKSHRIARFGSLAFALAAALFVSSPSYGFWFLFGYPHHTNDSGHYDDCGNADYGYIYHHDNTHDEPFFQEQTSSEHYAKFHGPRARYTVRQKKADPCKRVAAYRDDECDVHHDCGSRRCH